MSGVVKTFTGRGLCYAYDEYAQFRSELASSVESAASAEGTENHCTPSSKARFSPDSTSSIADAAEDPPLNDIENLGADLIPLERFKKNGVLSVTDFSAQVWCEKQLEFTLITGRRRRTPLMLAGTERHAELEKEDHEVVEVEVKTREDSLGLRLLNAVVLIELLKVKGKIRELWVFGVLDGVVVRGIIDEIICVGGLHTPVNPQEQALLVTYLFYLFFQLTILETEESSSTSPICNDAESVDFPTIYYQSGDNKRLLISDTKTRQSPTEPTSAQKRTAAMQLQLYQWMLEELRLGRIDWAALFNAYKVCDSYCLRNIEGVKYRRLLNIVMDSLLYSVPVSGLDPHNYYEFTQDPHMHMFSDRNATAYADMVNHISHTYYSFFTTFFYLQCDPQMPFQIEELNEYDNLNHLRDVCAQRFQSLPPLSPNVTIVYESKGKVFSICRVPYSKTTALYAARDLLDWWTGKRESEAVLRAEKWKCRWCEFLNLCGSTPLPQETVQNILAEREKAFQTNTANSKRSDATYLNGNADSPAPTSAVSNSNSSECPLTPNEDTLAAGTDTPVAVRSPLIQMPMDISKPPQKTTEMTQRTPLKTLTLTDVWSVSLTCAKKPASSFFTEAATPTQATRCGQSAKVGNYLDAGTPSIARSTRKTASTKERATYYNKNGGVKPRQDPKETANNECVWEALSKCISSVPSFSETAADKFSLSQECSILLSERNTVECDKNSPNPNPLNEKRLRRS